MSDSILVVNAGSSSIKFKLFRIADRDLAPALSGGMSGIGSIPALKVHDGRGSVLADRALQQKQLGQMLRAGHAVTLSKKLVRMAPGEDPELQLVPEWD